MAKILRSDTACHIMFGPFVDKTNGVDLEVAAGIITSIDHATTGIFLSKNGAAGAIRNQAVTASVLDAYGMFQVHLDIVDTNTPGNLRVMMAEAATFLPVHDDYVVIPHELYDTLFVTQPAAAINKFFDVASPVLTCASVNQVQDNATTAEIKTALEAGMTFATLTSTGALTVGSLVNNGVVTQTGAVTLTGGINAGAISGTLANDLITAASIANGAIDNATFAADVGSTAAATNIISQAVDKAITANTLILDLPTTTEFSARTLVAADYTIVSDLGTVQTGDSYAIVNGDHGLVSIQDDVDSILADTGELQTNQGNWLTATGFATPTNITAASGVALSATGADLILKNATFVQAIVAAINEFATYGLTALNTLLVTTGIKTATTAAPTDMATATNQTSILSKLLKYVQLLARKDAAITTDNATEVTAINANGGSGAGAFSNQTDGQEAIRDRGDAAWLTAAGFSAHSAADVAALVLTTPANKLATDANGKVTYSNTAPPTAADVKTALEADGGKIDHLWETTEDDGGVRRFTANALEQAPSGSGLDAAGVRGAIGMGAANLDAQLLDIHTHAAAAAAAAGTGAITWTYTVTRSDTGAPLEGCEVWVSTDSAGLNIIASGTTNDSGVVTFYLDASPGVYVWRKKSGFNFTNPDVEVVA